MPEQQNQLATVSAKDHPLAPPQSVEQMMIAALDSRQKMMIAREFPRDIKIVMEKLKAQLAACPLFAESAIYTKPVGKDPQTGKMKYARGLSIRAAEALVADWGNCAVSVLKNPDTETAEYIDLLAVFVDYESNITITTPGRCAKSYTKRHGGVVVHSADRFTNVILKAEQAKLYRDCVLRIIPPGVREELFNAAELAVDARLDEGTQQKLVAAFASMDVSAKELETLIGRTVKAFTKQDRRHLLELHTAIREEDTTVAEAFSPTSLPRGATATAEVQGAPSVEDVLGPKGKAAEGAQFPSDAAPPPPSTEAPEASKKAKAPKPAADAPTEQVALPEPPDASHPDALEVYIRQHYPAMDGADTISQEEFHATLEHDIGVARNAVADLYLLAKKVSLRMVKLGSAK